ncbi:MAG: peptidoglycan DD-metalloendopeptidase family protein [Chloroflexi bacterium]|nr:peptidoglycan DD-metalloendopeptidase family protein [Chloroflexota bacterium]
MRKAALLVFVLAFTVPLGTPAAAAQPNEDPVPAPGLKCVERVAVPTLENVIDAKWSPDGSTLALVRFVRIPSATNPSGYIEDEVLETLDMWSGKVRSYGSIEYGRPAWSGSGRYLAYWGPKADFLQIMERGEIVARLTPSMPEFRWSGDALVYIERSTIRVWTGGRVPGTVVKLLDRLVPHYPRDDWSWSGDASRFTLTRYVPDEPEPERLIGWTETGDVAELDVPGATLTEWAPSGAILLIRYPTRLELRDEIGLTGAYVPIARNAVHSWGADGRTLLVRTLRPSVAAGEAFEEVKVVWPVSRAATAILPNVFGTRAFSPNGRYFGGTVRTDRHDSRLEVFRCVEVPRGDVAVPDPEAAARLAQIDGGTGRLIRPVAGAISQFVHIAHSGVDIAAPFGSPVVAADAGIVTKIAFKEEGGLQVCVQHAGGLETCYYHASAFLVAVGERVARGQAIALVGMSGRATGPHVHWEAKLDGKVLDPLLR